MQAFSTRLQVTMDLRDTILRREENRFTRDYSQGYCYYKESQHLTLYGNFTFHFAQVVLASISSNRSGLPTERHQIHSGAWQVEIRQGRTALVLNNEDGSEVWWYIEDGETGVQYLDGKAWQRCSIHDKLEDPR